MSAPALTPLVFSAALDAVGAAPGGATVPATGTGSFAFTTGSSPFFDPGAEARKIVTYSVTVGDLSSSATEAHIHGPANESGTADIIVPLSITSRDSLGALITGTFSSTSNAAVSMDSLLVLFTKGMAYVDVHTARFAAGEIRGQVRSRSFVP